MTNTRTVQIIQDPDNPDDLLLDLGTELCEQLGWAVGDTLKWTPGDNGSWILTKISTTSTSPPTP